MMLQKAKIGLLLIALGFIIGCGKAVKDGRPTIAEDGEAKAVVVVAEDAPESDKHAAAELANFLGQMTETKFEVVSPPASGKSRLLIGPKAAKLAALDFSTDGLGSDGVVIRTVGNDLILAGGHPRGTLYAVYTFLDHFGCRWWSSKVSTIPKKRTLKVGKLDVRYVPALEYRSPFWFDAFDGDWAVRNKCNGHAHHLDAKRGGRHIYEGHVHTFYRNLIPPEKYFKAHPEWFSEINGKRKYERAQLCLTNEEMRRELVKNLKAQLRKNPAATIASVSQNDWHGYCQCSKCAAIDKREGSPAGLMLRFVNAVAADIEEEFPHVAISTLAYQYTRKPPKYVKPRHNVIVRLCSIECSFSKPLADERNKKFRDDIVGWSKVCNRLYIWDYTTNFRHHITPHPNLRVLGPNVKFFVGHNVKGIFEQGAYTTNGAEMAELRAWVLAKLLWDPTRNGQKLIDEFIEGYYGAAAPHIKAYLKVTHNAVEVSGDWLGCFADIDASNVKVGWATKDRSKFITLETLSQCLAHLKAAEAAVADDPDLRFRVQCAQLPVMYAFMMCWKPMRQKAQEVGAEWPMPDSIDDAFNHFVKIARKNNITRVDEWNVGYGNLEKALKQAKK